MDRVIFALGLEPRRFRRRAPTELARVAARALRAAAPRVLDVRDWRVLVEVETLAPLSDRDPVSTEALARLVDLCMGWTAHGTAVNAANAALAAAISFAGLVPVGERGPVASQLRDLEDENSLDPEARALGVELAKGAPGIEGRLASELAGILDRVS